MNEELQKQIAELTEYNKKLLDKIHWNTANINELKDVSQELIEEAYALGHGLLNQRADIGLKKDSRLWALFSQFLKVLDNLNRKLDSGGEKWEGKKK